MSFGGGEIGSGEGFFIKNHVAGQPDEGLSGYMRDKIQFSERNYFTSKNPPSACIVMLTSSFLLMLSLQREDLVFYRPDKASLYLL